MSGIETAGLVLAVLPLFISALEHYNSGLDPVRAFMNRDRELPQLIRKLRNQHVHYEQTLRLLLAPLTTNDELAEMLAIPNGSLWKDERIALEMKGRLEDAYVPYLETMGEIKRIMEKIAEKLDVDRATEVTRNDLEAMLIANPAKADQKFEFSKRVRFGMSRKKIKSLLEELDECNRELERFTEKSEKLESYRQEKKPSFATKLQSIQFYAKCLHQALVDSWSACSCRSSHVANLQLEHRFATKLSRPRLKFGPTENEACFTLSLPSMQSPGIWHEAEIRMVENEDEFHPQNERPSSKCSTIKSPRSVSFMTPPGSPSFSRSSTIISNSMHDFEFSTEMKEVKDICSALETNHLNSSCIGFNLDRSGILRGVYPVKSRKLVSVQENEVISLDELLDPARHSHNNSVKLSKKDRYMLAVTLASSILQLHATPWFNDHWTKKDILFYRTTVLGARIIADIEHPYVSREYRVLRQNEQNQVSSLESSMSNLSLYRNKNTVLLALAVTLLELYFGQPCESQEQLQGFADMPGTNSQVNPWALCAFAHHWADIEQENLSAAFSSAVAFCLRSFGDPSNNLQDPQTLEAAMEGIVLPLQDELMHFVGKKV